MRRRYASATAEVRDDDADSPGDEAAPGNPAAAADDDDDDTASSEVNGSRRVSKSRR